MRNRLIAEWQAFTSDFRLYRSAHVNGETFFLTVYSIAAATVALLCFRTWMRDDWPAVPLATIPPLLGFSLAAYALLMVVGSDGFREYLARVEILADGHVLRPHNVYMRASGTFLHFILVQIVALLLAVIGNAHPFSGAAAAFGTLVRSNLVAIVIHDFGRVLDLIAYYFFALAITTSVAAAFAVLTLTDWYVKYAKSLK